MTYDAETHPMLQHQSRSSHNCTGDTMIGLFVMLTAVMALLIALIYPGPKQ